MTTKFKFLENIATADAAFEAFGESPEELFQNAALALFEVMADTKEVRTVRGSRFEVRGEDIKELLFNFLSELVFLKDQKSMLFSKFKVKIKTLHATSYKLHATIWGEKIDPARHNLKVDVKAVTRHQFKIKKEKDKHIARVVLDV